jgi:cell division protein FtsL
MSQHSACVVSCCCIWLPLQTQTGQLAEAATKINKLITKLEQAKQQLERAQKEIKELREAAQVCERLSRQPMQCTHACCDSVVTLRIHTH